MSMKRVCFAAMMVVVLCLAAPRAQAQVVTGGGYIGFGTPGLGGVASFGTPVVAPVPVVPYLAPYPTVVVPRPVVVGPVIGTGWGYGPRYVGPRHYGPRYYGPRHYTYHYRYGRRW